MPSALSRCSYGLEYYGLNYANRIHSIQTLQKRALRCIFRLSFQDSVTPIFKTYNILTFPLHIEYSFCCFIFKIIHGLYPNVCGIVESSNSTRGGSAHLLLLAQSHSNIGRNTFAVRGSLLWNGLPARIRSL